MLRSLVGSEMCIRDRSTGHCTGWMSASCPVRPAYWGPTPKATKRRQRMCSCCGHPVLPGHWIFPPDAPRLVLWAHQTCALKYVRASSERDHESRRVCKHWARSGKCAYGDLCFFGHPEHALEALKAKQAAAAAEGKQVRRKPGSRRCGGVKKRVHVANAGRVAEFRRFMLSRFGESRPVSYTHLTLPTKRIV
eukprot:TRINITY_DN11519_c0_g1_i2.p1 TRINITY_DN11519_c0_g1~~TRINITY_DN11519_c0_g1_i2.p1  ORF type:complete len:193 (-),score=17.52 TRINITY_DN11519_c0_g1_i2:110-688(-)